MQRYLVRAECQIEGPDNLYQARVHFEDLLRGNIMGFRLVDAHQIPEPTHRVTESLGLNIVDEALGDKKQLESSE